MRILAYSDLHATTSYERLFSDPSASLQEWRVQRFYERLHQIYLDKGCEALFDLGDTTDDRSAIPLPTIKTVLTGIDLFPKSPHNIKLVGNHEQFAKSTLINTGRLFERKFHVVENREILKIGSTTIIAVSFPESDAELTEWLQSTFARHTGRDKVILIGHFQITGAKMNSGVSMVGVPQAILAPVPLVLLGHVHRGQAVRPNVHYIGSPFQQNFGESADLKRVAVIDTETATVEWVQITGFPEYKRLTFEQFLNVDPTSEDRVCVYLQSPEESEAFYSHPLSSRVVEPIYQYALQPTAGPEIRERSVTPQDILARYVKQDPPSVHNIIVSDPDMVELGLQIAGITE